MQDSNTVNNKMYLLQTLSISKTSMPANPQERERNGEEMGESVCHALLVAAWRNPTIGEIVSTRDSEIPNSYLI